MGKRALAALAFIVAPTAVVAAGYNELNIGISELDDGDYELAIAHLGTAIAAGDLIPDQMHIAYVDRGQAHMMQEEPDKAIADFTAALALSADDSATMSERSFAYVAAGQPEKALDDLAVLLKRNPDDLQINWQAGLVDWALGRYAEAGAAFEVASNGETYAYPWLWQQLANLKEGKSITAFRAPQADRPGYHVKDPIYFGWPEPLVDFYTGQQSEESVQDVMEGQNATTAMICEGNFYLAEWHFEHNDAARAKPMMVRALAACPKSYTEFRMAKLELKKMP